MPRHRCELTDELLTAATAAATALTRARESSAFADDVRPDVRHLGGDVPLRPLPEPDPTRVLAALRRAGMNRRAAARAQAQLWFLLRSAEAAGHGLEQPLDLPHVAQTSIAWISLGAPDDHPVARLAALETRMLRAFVEDRIREVVELLWEEIVDGWRELGA